MEVSSNRHWKGGEDFEGGRTIEVESLWIKALWKKAESLTLSMHKVALLKI